MDAKPQRLARSRTLRDENQPPLVLPNKTLHHRNKSSPALSTIAQLGAGKPAPPKRTAFADVTNSSRGINAIVDDSIIPHKATLEIAKEKVNDYSKPANPPLQKPAQRPLSVSSIKGFFNNLGTSNHQSLAAKKQTDAPSDNRIATKTLARKSTKVFRELDEQAVIDAQHAEPVPLQEEIHAVDSLPLPISDNSTAHEVYYDVRSDGVPLQEPAYIPPALPEDFAAYEPLPIAQPMPALIQPHPVRPLDARPQRRSGSLGAVSYGALPEQWDAEHFVESETDYTTARSLKSRGECTTNQTTVILAPKVTAAAEQEIAEANFFVLNSQEALELEEDESWDTTMVAEYSEEIFSYMRSMEEQMRPNPHYMDNQTEVQWSMRAVLMDWLVQVHHRFSLLPETLFLCVNYIDRFLSCKVVSLGKLQLVGATAIFVAAKYEEINCPSVQEIVYMVDGGYSVDEILKAERFMLSMLQFELGFPGPMSFLRRISKADDYDLETRTLAKYFMELTIMDERFVGCIPSYTAAGAHCLARLMLDKGSWSPKHVHYSGYTYGQLRPLLLTMLSCCDDPQRHHGAIFDKYSDKRFKRASTFVQSELNKGFALPAVTVRHSIGYPDISSTYQSYVYQ